MTISSRRGTVLLSALALTATLGLAGCSAGVNGAAGGASTTLLPGVAPETVDSVAFDTARTPTDRSVIVTGWATILVDDPQAAADAAAAIAEAAGGRIDARSLQAPTDYSGGSATLTLRVPADSLDRVLAELGDLGRIQNVSTNASDVTIEVQDLEARIGALRSSIERLEALQAEATSIDALIQLETAISDRQAQLESLEAQQRYYDDQITMSTLTLDLVSQPVVAEPDPGSFWDGVVKGWQALGTFFAGLVIALGVLLPWLIPIVVVGAIVWIIVAATRSKRRRAARQAPPAQPPVSG
ncbi:MAG TPA: DUF4349 domain-containing protein [Microbacteriaceae bacterium]|nr:DUF4349 domain-containing protein [Microbacteriaceae bacterium]